MPATNREYEEISQTYAEVREELEELFKVGTDRTVVNDLLQEATRALEAGDHDKARLSITEAESTAHAATLDFLNNWISEVRDILLSARSAGADISTSRPLLITAQKALNGRKYRKAANLTFKSFDTLGGVSDNYRNTLKTLMKAKYNYTLVESFGLDMRRGREQMDLAFGELKKGDYEAAIVHSKRATSEVRHINKVYKRRFQKVPDAKGSPNEGDMGITTETIDTEVTIGESVDGVGSSDVFDERLHTLKNVNSSLNRKGVDISTLKEVERRMETAMVEGDQELADSLFDQIRDEISRMVKEADDQYQQEASDPPDLPRVPEDEPGTRTRVTERLQKVKEQITLTEDLGIDTTWLLELEGRGEEALAQGKYGLADDLIDQISSNIPKLTADHLDERFEGARSLIKGAQKQGFDVDEQRALLSEAGSAAAKGELDTMIELLDRVEIGVHAIRSKGTAEEAIHGGKRMGADVSDAEMHYAMGWKRQQDGEMEEALRYYSKAIEEAIEAGKALAWKGE